MNACIAHFVVAAVWAIREVTIGWETVTRLTRAPDTAVTRARGVWPTAKSVSKATPKNVHSTHAVNGDVGSAQTKATYLYPLLPPPLPPPPPPPSPPSLSCKPQSLCYRPATVCLTQYAMPPTANTPRSVISSALKKTLATMDTAGYTYS